MPPNDNEPPKSVGELHAEVRGCVDAAQAAGEEIGAGDLSQIVEFVHNVETVRLFGDRTDTAATQDE